MTAEAGARRPALPREVVDGLENAPEAFAGMLERRTFGNQIVRV